VPGLREASVKGRGPWRCFFCDELFRREADASAHFGGTRLAEPGCQLKGVDTSLLDIIRKQEEELQRYRSEDTDLIRAMRRMESEHDVALRRAEEKGYDRGVRDMSNNVKEVA
jgi:hypothetical protein